MRTRCNARGFTLIEALLSLALIALLSGIAIPAYLRLQTRNDLDVATEGVALSLRRAMALSLSMDGDTDWGVRIATGDVTLFKGASYAARDSAYDEVTSMPSSISPSGLNEVVYRKFTGMPQTTGTVTLTSGNGEVQSLSINAYGTITY